MNSSTPFTCIHKVSMTEPCVDCAEVIWAAENKKKILQLQGSISAYLDTQEEAVFQAIDDWLMDRGKSKTLARDIISLLKKNISERA